MKRLLIIATVLLALTAAAAWAGSTGCTGEVVVGPEWTTVEDAMSEPLPKDHPRYSPPEVCRFKTNSPLGKRILAKCPAGTMCTLDLSIENKPSDHRVEGNIRTIVKWPVGGVERQ